MNRAPVAEKYLTPDGALPTGNYPKHELVRFVPAAPLEAEVIRLRAEAEDWKASQQYRYIGADGKPVLARALEDEVIRLRAQVAAAEKLAEAASALIDEVDVYSAIFGASARKALSDARTSLAAWWAA